jgi:hypothetical protein
MKGNGDHSRLNTEPIIPKITPNTAPIIPMHAPNSPAAIPNKPPKIPIHIGKVKIINKTISKVELERVITFSLINLRQKSLQSKKCGFWIAL